MEEAQTQNPAENGNLPAIGIVTLHLHPVTGHGNSEVAPARNKEAPIIARPRPRRPPHNYVAIVKDADAPFDTSSVEKIWEQLLAGVVLLKGRRKYWVDKKLNKNCFIIYARELAIVWGDNPQNWRWGNVKETGDVDIEVAQVINVCWFEISGKFRTITLSPKTKYEVVLVVMRAARYSSGWRVPVTFSIVLPDGSKMEKTACFLEIPAGGWINVVMGEFEMSPATVGEIKFSMSEFSSSWKRGMVIKGVAFQPLN